MDRENEKGTRPNGSSREIFNAIKEDIRELRLLKIDLVGIMDGLIDSICIDYSMKTLSFINIYSSLQKAEKEEDDIMPLSSSVKVDESTVRNSIISIQREMENLTRICGIIESITRLESNITGQELSGMRLSNDVFTLSSTILSIPLDSIGVNGINVDILTNVLKNGVQGALDGHVTDTVDFGQQYKKEALIKLNETLTAYTKFLHSAAIESHSSLTRKNETQKQKDFNMESEITKAIHNTFSPMEYGDNLLFVNDNRSKLLLINKLLDYIEVCEGIYNIMHKDDDVAIKYAINEKETETKEDDEEGLTDLLIRYNNLKSIVDKVCRVYKVQSIGNLQLKKVTQYTIKGHKGDYVSLKNVANDYEPVAFTDRLMSVGIISNKMVFVIYSVIRSICRDSDFCHNQFVLGKKDRKNPTFTTLNKSVINILSGTSLVNQKAASSKFANNILLSEVVNVNTINAKLSHASKSEYTTILNQQFESQIERLLAAVLAAIKQVASLNNNIKDTFSPEKYNRRIVCEDLSRLLASEANFRFIGNNILIFELELIPKEVRKDLCGDKSELDLISHPSFSSLSSLFALIKEPLVHYDSDNGMLFYIPMGKMLNHRTDEDITMANFCYSFTKDKRGDKGQKSNDIVIKDPNGTTVIDIEYNTDSVYAWLYSQNIAVEQYATVGSRTDRLFRIYSDELSYGKVYQKKLNKADTKQMLTSSTIMLGHNELATIRNDMMFNENMGETPYQSIIKENKLIKIKPNGSLIINDVETANESKIFLTKGNILGNDFFVFNKVQDLNPYTHSDAISYLGRLVCPSGKNTNYLNFNISTTKQPVKFSLETWCIGTNPNHTGKKGKNVGINTLKNNAMYSSRKVLLTILSKYISNYANYYSSPFALSFIFQKYKRDILTEYFANLKIILEIIIKDDLGDFFGKVFNDTNLTPVIYNLIYNDASIKGISESVDLSINGSVIDEVINMFLLVQKNKKMQLMYTKTTSAQDRTTYDKDFLYYEPRLNNRPTPEQIDDMIIDNLDFTEDSLNYDFLTLEDLWGIPVTSSEKATVEKSYQVFNVIKGVFKPSLSNLNPIKPAEKTYKNTLSNVLRALYGLYMYKDAEIKAPVYTRHNNKDNDLKTNEMNLNDVVGFNDTSLIERKNKTVLNEYMLTPKEIPFDALEKPKSFIGFFENNQAVDWLEQIDWVKYGVVTETGEKDSNWISAYKTYMKNVMAYIPIRDIHKDSTFGKTMLNTKINQDYLLYQYIINMLETKCKNISSKNTLFFNKKRQNKTETQTGGTSIVRESLIDGYYKTVSLTKLSVNDVNYYNEVLNIADALLHLLGIKAPQTGYVINNIISSNNNNRKYTLDMIMDENNLNNLSETLRRLGLGEGLISPSAIVDYEKLLIDICLNSVKAIEYFTSYDESVSQDILSQYGIPTNVNTDNAHDILAYARDEAINITEETVIELPFIGTDNYLNQTYIRDICMMTYLFKNSTTDLVKTLVTQGTDTFEKKFKDTFMKSFDNYGDQVRDAIFERDDFQMCTDEDGRNQALKVMLYINDRVASNSTHPVEQERIMCNILDRLFVARDGSSTSLINKILSDLVTDKNLNLESLRKIETDIEVIAKRNAFYNSIENYAPLSEVTTYGTMMSNVLNTLNAQYKVSLPNLEQARVDRQRNNKLYQAYLQTGNSNLLDDINFDSISFELLTDNAWDKNYTVVPKYSVRGMVRRNPNILTGYVNYQQIGGQIYSEFDLEQEISGGNNNISISGKTKTTFPGYVTEFTHDDIPGIIGTAAVTTKEILATVPWYTESSLPETCFTEVGIDVSLNINPYDVLDIWCIHKQLLSTNKDKHTQYLNSVCNPGDNNTGVIMNWIIDNGAKLQELINNNTLEVINERWNTEEYKDLRRVISIQSWGMIPRIMNAVGLKIAYDNLLESIQIFKGKVDESYVVGVFNYFVSRGILNGYCISKESTENKWKMECTNVSKPEDINVGAKTLVEGYEQFCEDYYSSIFFLQSATATTDNTLQNQYQDYWHNLPRPIISNIMGQTIKVERGIHNNVYSATKDGYKLPFKKVSVEDVVTN